MQNPLWSDFFKRKETAQDKALRILEQSPIFTGVSRNDLKKIYKIIHLRQYKRNEQIFRTGDPGVGMYIVESGRVGVYVLNSETEEENLVAEMSSGESFGDFALFTDSIRTATIRALCPTNLLGFCKPDLMNFINRNPLLGSKILIQILGLAGRRLEETNRQLSLARRELQNLSKEVEELKKESTGGV